MQQATLNNVHPDAAEEFCKHFCFNQMGMCCYINATYSNIWIVFLNFAKKKEKIVQEVSYPTAAGIFTLFFPPSTH